MTASCQDGLEPVIAYKGYVLLATTSLRKDKQRKDPQMPIKTNMNVSLNKESYAYTFSCIFRETWDVHFLCQAEKLA